jgi:hypothetical protein
MPRERKPSLLSVKAANQQIRGQAQTRLAQDASQIDLDADQPLKRKLRNALSFHGLMEHDPAKRWAEAAVAARPRSFS